MRTFFAVSALATLGCFALTDVAGAQIAAAPGTEFYATPLSKSGISLFAPGQIAAPAAAAAPVAAAAPAPVKRRARRRKAS